VTTQRPHRGDRPTLEPFVRKLEYRMKLDKADRAALLALPYTLKTMEQHQCVVREGDRAQYSCLMVSGFSVRHKTVAGGCRQIVAIHMKGEMVDLQNSFLKTADHSVQMLTVGTVAMVHRDEIGSLALKRPAIGRAMMIDTLVDASVFREWIANVGRRDARTRIAHVLCEFALRLKFAGLGRLTSYRLPMTQQQLGDTTGLTSVHVSRTLKSLEADGLIQRLGQRCISITNWKSLADVGDFQSGYLHLRDDEPRLRQAMN
jgi:CRP-like cAMP-binding protein